jgi:hypothetical protein
LFDQVTDVSNLSIPRSIPKAFQMLTYALFMIRNRSSFRTYISSFLVLILISGGLQVFALTNSQSAFAATGDSGSIQFNGTSNYLTIGTPNSAFGFGTTDFTIEFWWYATTAKRSDVLDFWNSGATNMTRLDIGYGITGGIQLYTDNGCSIDSGLTPSWNQWTHIALTRSSGSLYFWVNGAQKGSISCNKDFGSAGYSLSMMKDHGANSFVPGNLTNIRVVKNNAVYTSAFTPSTSPLGKVNGTSFLLSAIDGDLIKDWSDNNVAVTAPNGALFSSSSPFPLSVPAISAATISGNPIYGEVLTANTSVSGNPSPTVTYSWKRNGTTEVGTASTYTVQSADVGTMLSVTATAVNSQGTRSLTSSSTSTVTTRPITLTSAAQSKTYTGITATISNSFTRTSGTLAGSDAISELTYRYTSTGGYNSLTAPTDAGTYTITPSAAVFTTGSASNYSITYATSTLTIGAATPTLSLALPSSALVATYDTAVTITATTNTQGSVTFKSGSSTICTSVSTATVSASIMATCSWTPDTVNTAIALTANFVPSDSANYTSLTSAGSLQINVGKASQSITFSQPSNMTYGDADQALTYSVNSGLAVVVTSSTTSICTIVSNKIHIVSPGTCTVAVNQTGNSSYSAATQVTRSITITGIASTISISDTTTAYTYTGLAQGPSTSATSGSTGTATYSYQGRLSTTYGPSATKPTNAGTYTVRSTLAASGNYASASSASVDFEITKASLTITSSSHTVTYGDATPTITASYSGLVNSESSSIISGQSCVSTYLTSSSAGIVQTTSCSGGTSSNYLITYVPGSVTVNTKNLTISGPSGSNKEFNGTRLGTATGTPTLVGKVGSDDVLLGGTPTFTFASANVADGISLVASGYTLTGSTAGNYTLTQPTVRANITAKAARIAATNTTVAFGAVVTSGVTASGLISPDAVGSVSYTYTGTGTSTPPTAVGVYTVTPSNAVFSTGSIGNYTISYDTATVTILAKYTITYNANGGSVASSSTTTADFVVGDTALTLPTTTRANYTFTGWYTLQTNGVQVTGAYTPTATATLWARWIQNSLYGMGINTKILTITTLSGVGNTYSANAAGGTIAIEYLADALPAGTIIDAYILSDTSTATTLIGAGNDYVMSLVLAWVATDSTVPTTATGKAISMTITNTAIKKGAKIYSVIGLTPTLLTTATTDGSAVISITDDPQIIIAITKPDAPTGVSATSGGNASTTVSWTAPSDGGSAITGYTATSNAGQTCSSATTSCSVTGLTNGTPYTFIVTATNTIGTSDPSSASASATPATPVVVTPPVVTPPSSGGGGGYTYVEPTPTVDPAVVAAALAVQKALVEKAAAEAKVVAAAKAADEAKALAEKKAADEAELAAIIKAVQEKADAESLIAAKKLQDELVAAQLKAEEELRVAAALKLVEEQRVAAEKAAVLAASKKITTVYSTTAAFKLNKTYTNRLNLYTKKISFGSTVTCIGYAKSSKTLSYAKAKVVATSQAKALCSSMKKINPTLITKSIVYPASKAPVTTVNQKWIPVSYRIESPVN